MHWNTFDEQLIEQLKQTRKIIDEYRASLFQPGHQCVCDRTGLCAHHAAAANALADTSKALLVALACLE